MVKSMSIQNYSANELLGSMVVKAKDVQNIKASEVVFPGILRAGYISYVIARAETGKTALIRHIAKTAAEAGYKVMYFDMDSPGEVIVQMAELAELEDWTYINPDAAKGGSIERAMLGLQALLDEQNDLSNYIFIFDTLKKFADMINKNQLKKLISIHRGLCSLGSTVLGAGHENKMNPNKEDQYLIPEGTNDLRSDVDNLIILEKNDDVITSLTSDQNPFVKNRARLEPISFRIAHAELLKDRTVKILSAHIPFVSETEQADKALKNYLVKLLTTAISNVSRPTQANVVREACTLHDGYAIKQFGSIGLNKMRVHLQSLADSFPTTVDKTCNAKLYSVAEVLDE